MADKTVHYRITPIRPKAHLFEVVCRVESPHPEGQRLSLPAWIPGSYMIRDFARHVVELRAENNGQPVAVTRHDKSSWDCTPCAGPLTVIYQVYAWDLSVRGAHLDTTHGFFNGACMFLRVHGQEEEPCIVDIQRPSGDAYADWRVATALVEAKAQRGGFGAYQAGSYDELIDHPVEMGTFTARTFDACGVPHEVIITGRHRTDMERLCGDLKKICEHHIRFFGEPAPMSRYVFLVQVVGDGYGGLEHRASTSLLCSRSDLPVPGESAISDSYRGFLGLCSHEYFHTWNVKRIKPAEFVPYDLTREVHTRQLWIFEGITSYYDDLALVRCGLIEPESYLELLARNITRLLRGTGRFRQSVSDSSFDAWTRFYKQDENAPNAIVSYYTKGALIALTLDLQLRRSTGGNVSLDHLMRLLWERYGVTGTGVPDGEVERLAAQLAGEDLSPMFDSALRDTRDLPLSELLGEFGVQWKLRPADSSTDKGGRSKASGANGEKRRSWMGVRSTKCDGGTRLTHVLDEGPAQAAGLSAGDVVIAVDGLRVKGSSLDQVIGNRNPDGTSIAVHAFRRDELMQFHVELAAAPEDTCELTLVENPDAETRRRREAWLQP